MANITLDQTPVLTTVDNSDFIALSVADKLKHVTKGNLFAPYVGMINGKASIASLNAGLLTKIDKTVMGQPLGVATLNSSGRLYDGQTPIGAEIKVNKVRDFSIIDDTRYPTIKAVYDRIFTSVNASFKGGAELDTNGSTAAIGSWWIALIIGTYTGLGDVTLKAGSFGVITKTGVSTYELIQENLYPAAPFTIKSNSDGHLIDERLGNVNVQFIQGIGGFQMFEYDGSASEELEFSKDRSSDTIMDIELTNPIEVTPNVKYMIFPRA